MASEMAYYRELGLRVQRSRKKIGLTQEGLAALVGLSRTSVVNIERGRQKVLALTLVRMARALKEDVGELAREPQTEIKMDELVRGLSESAKRFVLSAVTPSKKEQ